MESFLPRGGFQLPFQRRLSRLYNDTKKSSDFVKESAPSLDDPDIKALHRKLRIQKDRLVSWGLEWSDPNQAAEIDESLSKAGLSDLVGSIMATIKDILAEAEPLWLASRQAGGTERASEKSSIDRKAPSIVWDKGRFEDLVKDLTASIDTLCELSRTRSAAAMSSRGSLARSFKSTTSTEDLRPYSSTRIQTPQQINLQTLTSLRSVQAMPISGTEMARDRAQEIFFMSKQAYVDLNHQQGPQPSSPLLVEYAPFNPMYSATGIMPDMSQFEKLSAGLQTDSQRSPGSWIGLPLLLGYYEDMAQSRLALIYQFPPGFNPVTFENLTQNPLDSLYTLKELLNRPDFEPTLEAKFRLAHNLVNTVFDMHARGITHGNLSVSAISFCNTVGNDPSLPVGEVDVRRPLVSLFDLFPEDHIPGEPTPGESPSTFLLHRHPLDPRTTSQSPFAWNNDTRSLDLYSLAMMLVSIGLWTQLENLVPNQSSPSISESVLQQLAIRCGTPYMRAVQACWNAVDQELAHRGSTEEILSQVQIRASRYLEACCILDGLSGLDERLGDDSDRFSYRREWGIDIVTEEAAGPSASTQLLSTKEDPGSRAVDIKQVPKTENIQVAASERAKDSKPKVHLYPQVPLPTEVIEQWHGVLMPQINMALRHFYRNHPESVEISIESIGESLQQTKPTVLVVCTSVRLVRGILKKKLGVFFDGTMGIGLKVCHGSMVLSRKGPMASTATSQHTDTSKHYDSESSEDEEAANPNYQAIPQNGASIGTWIGDKHLPPVSFGGLVVVDDKTYGMTVHHMLDDPEQATHSVRPDQGVRRDNAPPRSSAAAEQMMHLQEGESSAEDSGFDFSDSESELSLTDITSDDEDDEEEDEFNEAGDIPGVEPGCGDGFIITQPALDDVPEGFYPSEETMDEDHLDTYRLGEVHATSGIRRYNLNGLVHEIDWALFEFQGERMPRDNAIPRAASKSTRSTTSVGVIQPTEVVPVTSLPGLDVQCIARTSGLQIGQILPALTSVRIYGRVSPSHTYQVSGRCSTLRGHPLPATEDPPRFYPRSSRPLGVPGDSGAWIVDRPHGRLCGHILAWSERKQVAYICPMEVLLLDMAETLDARDVRLPGGRTIISNPGRDADEEDEEVIEISDLDEWSEEDEDGGHIPRLQEVHEIEVDSDEDSGGRGGGEGSRRGSKRILSARREQRFSQHQHDRGSSERVLAADIDKMHL
ncbi:hypothetical protein GGR53DRAFT_462004 [Hypoxylon sp. FL1150]|nr:hypothetical protein GGR53DRAFT_462004 [Hypoxylon sp. FL1150]